MFQGGMTAEDFRTRYGYIPGSQYQGGQIDQTMSGVDGEYIVHRDGDTAETYHTRYYRQQITNAHIE